MGNFVPQMTAKVTTQLLGVVSNFSTIVVGATKFSSALLALWVSSLSCRAFLHIDVYVHIDMYLALERVLVQKKVLCRVNCSIWLVGWLLSTRRMLHPRSVLPRKVVPTRLLPNCRAPEMQVALWVVKSTCM